MEYGERWRAAACAEKTAWWRGILVSRSSLWLADSYSDSSLIGLDGGWQVHRLLSLPIRMSLADFCQNFDTMEVCHLSEDTLSESGVKKPWKCTSHHGRWIPQQGTWASLFTHIHKYYTASKEELVTVLYSHVCVCRASSVQSDPAGGGRRPQWP